MRLVAAIFLAAILAAGSCSSSGPYTAEAVAVPDELRPVAEMTSGDAELQLLADGSCFRLLIEIDGRRQVDTEDRCTPGKRSFVANAEAAVIFNDRDRTRTRCDDNNDCPGWPADAELPGPVLYGRLHPPADLGCIDVGGFASGLIPDDDGYVFTTTSSGRDVGGDPLYFLDDGRFIGSDPAVISPTSVAACRSALELPTPDIPTSQWFVHVEGEDELGDDVYALSLLTDTGYDAEGAGLEVLADGFAFRVLLHPDTAALLLHFEADRSTSTRVDLPPEVVTSLRARTPCGMNLTLDLTKDLDATVRSDCPR